MRLRSARPVHLAVAVAACAAGTLLAAPALAAPSAGELLGPGYTIPDSEGHAASSHIGAYGPPGPAVHGDAETYCADPERKGPADAGGYSAPQPVTSWTSSVTGKPLPKDRLTQAAYVIGRYGQTSDNAQAAAVDAVVYEYLAGGTYAFNGARGKERLAYPVVSPTARTLAQGYLTEAKRLAGPYTLTITPSVKTTTAGTKVAVAVKVTTKTGTPVPKVSVALAESGSGAASGKVTTDSTGTANWSFTARTAGTASVTATADGLPATDLQVLTPKNPAAQRMLLAGGTTSVKDSATVTVDEATGGVTIRKKDPEGTRLVGAAFQLLDNDGKQAAAGKTDEQGVLVLDGLRAGTYRLRETSTGSPLHDLIPEQTITITAGRTAQANPLDLVDPFKKAALSVKKIDKNTGKTLAGAAITIRADETDKTGKHTPGKVLTTLTTGTNGTAHTALDVALRAGTRYWAAETTAPDGYQLDTTPVAFTALPGADVTVTLVDQRIPTTPPPTTPPPSTTPPTPPQPTVPPVTPPPSGSLAHTGADTTPWLIAGASGLLSAGGGLYLLSRRRRSDTADS
ncbi:SpaA isopeptide-forming pilin-related protein [Streptomyces sp. NPDC054835]|uniref:SpaA isopeptide-forming pilin-related protein n=1 Tax=Streptomyces exfoliatus TaxID=1905 RepID=UPI0004644D47|nr:SpaA isopeptide-forming pilin-related protein [Streptomyces exfoliatus]